MPRRWHHNATIGTSKSSQGHSIPPGRLPATALRQPLRRWTVMLRGVERSCHVRRVGRQPQGQSRSLRERLWRGAERCGGGGGGGAYKGCIGGLHGFFTPFDLGVPQMVPFGRESGFHSDGCLPSAWECLGEVGWACQGEACPLRRRPPDGREAVLGLALRTLALAAASVIAELLCRSQLSMKVRISE
jgi:hypothetical protein